MLPNHSTPYVCTHTDTQQCPAIFSISLFWGKQELAEGVDSVSERQNGRDLLPEMYGINVSIMLYHVHVCKHIRHELKHDTITKPRLLPWDWTCTCMCQYWPYIHVQCNSVIVMHVISMKKTWLHKALANPTCSTATHWDAYSHL